jgi:outer membrane protein TolC
MKTMMINRLKYISCIGLILFWVCSENCCAQSDTSFIKKPVTLSAYLNLVGKQNPGYLAERYNVSIAEAGIENAKVFPDPVLSVGVYDNQQSSMQLGRGYNTGISTALELGGKRSARKALAQSQYELSKALLLDFYRNLRADAALAYFNALRQYNLFLVLQSSYSSMRKLADADSIRFTLGAITETDVRQSRLEAGSLLNDLLQAEADWKAALVQLGGNAGTVQPGTFLVPAHDSIDLQRNFSPTQLILDAQANRADAVAAYKAQTVAARALQLARANRRIDLGISAGIQYSGAATNDVAPTPAYRSVNAGMSIPLKLSNAYKGEIKAAQFAIKQAAAQFEQATLQVQAEVTQAYTNFKTAGLQVAQYSDGLLSDARRVFEGKVYSYQRGETSLLEVLNARRTYNEVQQRYYQAQYNYAAALIELERTAGIWDIE